ncbi:hypothetical protein Taro_042412 [Colocasia esculenta]|uniref:Uncharacterized protein n=1 Tax=Colocasia esculenta TaxID=4460 RepID=A0A843WNX6_COLES|nr:hypothetical protein [Colocasia esculenta]
MAPAAFRVLDQCRVPISSGDPPRPREASVPLTFFDAFWIIATPLNRLLFYRWSGTTSDFVASALPRLKASLSSTLRVFYPFAGRLRSLPGEVDIYCTDADSVAFTLAESDGDFLWLAGDAPRSSRELGLLAPPAPAPGADGLLPLFAVKVTVFPRAGFCLGFSMHHTLCDGNSFARFLRFWASACRSVGDHTPADDVAVLIDRSLVPDPRGLYTAFLKGVKVRAPPRPLPDDIVSATFLLRRAHIEALRSHASRTHPPAPPAPPRYSSFVLTCAHVWVTILKARQGPAATDLSGATCFAFMVDCRARLKPPLPEAYFGNCIVPCLVEAPLGFLVGEDGLGHAAKAIAGAVGRLGEGGEALLEGAEGWAARFLSWLPRGLLSVAGAPRLGVYQVDFGWGRPEKAELAGIDRSGAMTLAENREGEGGIEVGLALRLPEMEAFASLFDAALDAVA